MKKIYTAFVAAMFATSSFAQPLAKVQANGPFANSSLRYQPNIKKPAGQPMNFIMPTVSNKTALPARVSKAASEADIILDQPAGTLHDNLYGTGEGYMVFFGYIFPTAIDGTVERYVEGNDGDVYIQNAIGTIPSGSWIKGYKAEGDTIKFNFPQKYYVQDATDDDGNPTGEKEYFYAFRAVLNQEGNSIVPDSTSQTMSYVLRNDSLIRVDNLDNDVYLALCADDGGWTGYADYYQAWYKMKETASVPPATAEVSKYQVDYINTDGQEDARIINLAIDGNDLYLGNLSDNAPENWAKGKIDGDKAVFEGKIYMGVDPVNQTHTFFAALGSEKIWDDVYEAEVDSFYFEKSITFDYDAAAKTLKSDGMFDVNNGLNSVYSTVSYEAPQIKPWVEIPASPKDPELLQFMPFGENYGYGALQFWFEKTSVDGNLLDANKLYYNLYFDDDLFTAYPDEYANISEEITDIPYYFSDNSFDFIASGDMHTMYYYMTGFTKLGIQTFYKDGDKVYKSNLVEYAIDEEGNFTPIETAIKGATAESNTVKSVSFSDLSGRRVSNLASGVYLKTMKMADGTQKTVKVVKK